MDILLAVALSTHLGFEGEYSSIHPHIGLQYENFIAGTFLNSEDNISVYGGLRSEFGKLGLEYGVVSGYDALGDVVPMVRGTYDLGDNVRAYAAPGAEVINNETNYGVVFGLEFYFK